LAVVLLAVLPLVGQVARVRELGRRVVLGLELGLELALLLELVPGASLHFP
jgi:hypothetical protein